jgi:tetratricopeptide (TPR) repeat protein
VVLALGQRSDLGSALAGWTEGDVGAAARQRLGGVLTSHADGTLSAHPLVRDSFRPLAMNPGSVQLASQLALDGLPAGAVGSRQEALRVLEIVELLLEADQWSAADELFRARTDKGDAFTWLPAAALGQRCALAFVGTPARQAMCAQELRARQLGFYLATVGLRAANAGDISIAQQYLEAGVDHERASGDRLNLAINLENRAHLLTSLGRPDLACADFALALDIYQDLGDVPNTRDGHAGLGLACAASGETTRAEHHFLEADRLEHRIDRAGEHLYSLRGASWADLLLRTNRAGPARRLTAANHRISTKHGWNESIARCERLLGRLDLAEGQLVAAGEHFEAAVATFRDGDYLLELAATLVHLGEQQRRAADHDPAERSCNEAIEIAAPRDLVPTHAAALAARARIRADRSGDSDLANARDDADHALRLASRLRQLPWQQLDALEAHAHIDRAEGADHGWAAQAQALRAILVPEGLDPDPLATVEAEAEAKAAADAAEPG